MSISVVDGGTDSDEASGRVQGPRCPWMVDNTRVRQFFRLLSLLNLLVLLLSVPFDATSCSSSDSDEGRSRLVHISVITSLNSVLALLFTLQFILRLRYFVAMKKPLKVRVAKWIPRSLRFSIPCFVSSFLLSVYWGEELFVCG